MFLLDEELENRSEKKEYTSTRNACKLCSPLGASVAFKGIKGCVPLIHGSQGCATYIRRYMISHYKEPVDIASSNFSEESTIFGGNANFCMGIDNIISQYEPDVIAIASTCLSETIGEDVKMLIKEYQTKHAGEKLPGFVYASTPSYQGSHMNGFHEAVKSIVETFAAPVEKNNKVAIFPGFVSPEDIRHLKDILDDFGLEYIMVPDYSDTLDNPSWDKYYNIPAGGTSMEEIALCGGAMASIEFGTILNKGKISGKVKAHKGTLSAGRYLEEKFGVPLYQMGHPIGVAATDALFNVLEKISGRKTPEKHIKERGRLIDSYVDAHKHLFGVKTFVYGEEDFAASLAGFLNEVGIDVALVASGGESGMLGKTIEALSQKGVGNTIIGEGMDFEKIRELAHKLKPTLLVGNSKGYYITRELGIQLVRVGFPIHDRYGGQRVLHLGYKGTQQLFDNVTNAIVAHKQANSPVGYKYM